MVSVSSQVPDGMLLVCKPKGWSSFDVVRKIKNMVRPQKVGHTGTLDPMATGLLPLVIGEATKLTRYLSAGTKRYHAVVRLGTATDTLDAEGKQVSKATVPSFDEKSIESVLENFRGEIEQVPPMFSALHHNGKRLYQLARKGEQVERKARRVQIHYLKLLDLGPDYLRLDIGCSAGTYIRTIASDMAVDLGTVGHLESLERTEVGDWKIEDAIEPQSLDRSAIIENLISLENTLQSYKHIQVPKDISTRLSQGNRLTIDQLKHWGVAVSGIEQIVWFNALPNSPIILVKVLPIGAKPAMEILRVLRPDQ